MVGLDLNQGLSLYPPGAVGIIALFAMKVVAIDFPERVC